MVILFDVRESLQMVEGIKGGHIKTFAPLRMTGVVPTRNMYMRLPSLWVAYINISAVCISMHRQLGAYSTTWKPICIECAKLLWKCV